MHPFAHELRQSLKQASYANIEYQGPCTLKKIWDNRLFIQKAKKTQNLD